MEMKKREIIESVKDNTSSACGSLYDYICDNCYKMSKYEIADLLKEIIYTVDQYLWNDYERRFKSWLIKDLEMYLRDEEENEQ